MIDSRYDIEDLYPVDYVRVTSTSVEAQTLHSHCAVDGRDRMCTGVSVDGV